MTEERRNLHATISGTAEEKLVVERSWRICYNLKRKEKTIGRNDGGGERVDERIWSIAAALEADGHMTADELAGKLGLSSKTVRSIVKSCQDEMEQAGFQITAKPGKGLV